jgi:hypothetical protein
MKNDIGTLLLNYYLSNKEFQAELKRRNKLLSYCADF